MQFGSYVREKRSQLKMGLRRFCLATDIDPSDWSKVERNIIAPTQNKNVLIKVAEALTLDKTESELLYDMANIAANKLPEHLTEDPELVSLLPALFRTIKDIRPTEDELRQYIEGIRESERSKI